MDGAIGKMGDEITARMYEFVKLAMGEYADTQGKSIVPARLVAIQNILRGAKALANVEIGDLEVASVGHFTRVRPGCTSDSQARARWTQTEEGQRYTRLKYLVKAMSEITTACGRTLRHLELEATDVY